MDETLIHSCHKGEEADYVLKIAGKDGLKTKIRLNVRPYVEKFLKKLSKYYEIYIFTASTFHYANVIVNFIDPSSKYINAIFDRTYCIEPKKGFFVKDLSIFHNRKLQNMVLVDNMPHSFAFQINNGIPISSFTKNEADEELKVMAHYLLEAAFKDDLTEFNRTNLNLEEITEYKEEELLHI